MQTTPSNIIFNINITPVPGGYWVEISDNTLAFLQQLCPSYIEALRAVSLWFNLSPKADDRARYLDAVRNQHGK